MAKSIHLYDTRRRQVAELEPIQPDTIRMYTCGPTVYSTPTVGNYRTYIFEDVLVKTLKYLGYTVDRVMNITDVGHLTSDADDGEDKMEIGAKREGTTAWEVAKRYEQEFIQGFAVLHLDWPAKIVRATDTIAQQIELIKTLEEKGHTYQIADGVYFDSHTFPKYAEFAHLDLEGQQAGARVDVQEDKRHPQDFALWKFSPADSQRDMEWESPWGTGFPGWHIECSAIAIDQLGPELDIHCGGVDHIPVHHTNEIAQSESATGKLFSRHWCHADFLLVDGGRMGKSLGNMFTLADLAAKDIDPLDFKFFTYSANYRAKLNFTWEAVESAVKNLTRIRRLLQEGGSLQGGEEYLEEFSQALADDLNLPRAIAALWEVAKSDLTAQKKQELAQEMDQVLSLDLLRKPEEKEVPDEVHQIIQERDQYRKDKNWAESDRLRQALQDRGYEVLDTPEGTRIQQ